VKRYLIDEAFSHCCSSGEDVGIIFFRGGGPDCSCHVEGYESRNLTGLEWTNSNFFLAAGEDAKKKVRPTFENGHVVHGKYMITKKIALGMILFSAQAPCYSLPAFQYSTAA
tara:strand:- start:635 stop:970 length:336 start_codon:yes stop_codon:yes gene_type:complete